MKCQKCGEELPEREIQESHDVPCYIFEGKDRKEKKQKADKEGRHWLCKKCHDMYEKIVFAEMTQNISEQQRAEMIILAKSFATRYFGGKHA